MEDLYDEQQKDVMANYANKHGIFQLFGDLMKDLIVNRPMDPIQYLAKNIYKVQKPAIFLIGPPLCPMEEIGKLVAAKFNLVYLSSKTLVFKAIERQTAIGIQASSFVEKDMMVPDKIMLGLVTNRLNEQDVQENGFLMVGFPMSAGQAFGLQKRGLLPSQIAICRIPDDYIVEKIAGNQYDPVSQKVYNLKYSPPTEPIYSRLLQRKKEAEVNIRQRLSVYHRHIGGVLNAFPKLVKEVHLNEIFGQEEDVARELQLLFEIEPIETAPRSFKLVLAGLPPLWNAVACEYIEKSLNLVHVSLRKALLKTIETKSSLAEQLKEYVRDPHKIPEQLAVELIINRLKEKDCQERGWVLDRYPRNAAEAKELETKGIQVNRVIWLEPVKGSMTEEDAAKYGIRMETCPLEQRQLFLQDLKQTYGLHCPSDPAGIFYAINAKGSFDNLLEQMEASLLRPIPNFH